MLHLCLSFIKAEFFYGDLTKTDLGILHYDSLFNSADCIIHNAWPVNFNLSLSSFEPQICGVRNIIDFSAKCRKEVPVTLMSTVGTADEWKESYPVPESHQTDFGLASLGYGQSKLLGSILLNNASVPTAIIRIGQIAGPRDENGEWNKQEWLPTIIASSVTLGVLPETIGPFDDVRWMSIEDVALSVLNIAGCTSTATGLGYFNLVNPNSVSRKDVAPAVQEFYAERGHELKQVGLASWIDAVEFGVKTPAMKLLDMYKGLLAASKAGHSHAGYATERSERASKIVREMPPVTSDLMQLWCRQWKFC